MLVDIKQNTDEWHEWRKGGVGSSDIAVIMGKSPFKTRHQLWLERTGQVERENLSEDYIVYRGTQLEPEARKIASIHLDRLFTPQCFIHRTYDHLRYSCDGHDVMFNEIIEIKCPQKKNHNLAKSGTVPEYYLQQIQYGLLVSGANLAYYCSYNPNDEEKDFVVIKVEPDRNLHSEMIKETIAFWELVKTMTPPELNEKDYLKLESNQALDLANEYIKNKNKIERLTKWFEIYEERMDKAKKELESITNLHNSKNFKVGKLKLKKVCSKGQIIYSEIPQLKGLDLEQYRGPSKNYMRVDVEE